MTGLLGGAARTTPTDPAGGSEKAYKHYIGGNMIGTRCMTGASLRGAERPDLSHEQPGTFGADCRSAMCLTLVMESVACRS